MLLSLFNLRKNFSLNSNTWKNYLFFLTIELHSSFLLNSHDDLLGKTRSILRCFIFLSTTIYRDYFILSEQFQNLIILLRSLLKDFFRSFNMAMEYNWYKWIKVSELWIMNSILFFLLLFYFHFSFIFIFILFRVRV